MKNHDGIQMAWLDNKIYVVQNGLERVRVYADEAPFNELQDEIKLKGLDNPMGLYASACSQSLLIGDVINDCFWKIQLPGEEVSRWDINDPPGRALAMSITPDDELLAVIRHDPPYKAFVDRLRREFEEAEQQQKFDADENDKRVENDDVNGGAENDDDEMMMMMMMMMMKMKKLAMQKLRINQLFHFHFHLITYLKIVIVIVVGIVTVMRLILNVSYHYASTDWRMDH